MPSVKAIERGTEQTESPPEMKGMCGVVGLGYFLLGQPEVNWNVAPKRVIVP
jgi:hypothetical protein